MLAPPTRPAMSVSAPRIVALRLLRKSLVIVYLVKLLPLLRKRWAAALAILGPQHWDLSSKFKKPSDGRAQSFNATNRRNISTKPGARALGSLPMVRPPRRGDLPEKAPSY